MTPRIAIACYKPKAGKSQELKALMRKHHGILKGENLVTDRAPVIMESKDGTIVEVFEWKSKAAIDQAHTNTVVLRTWDEYSAVCDYVPIGRIEEAGELFSEFTPFT